MAYLPVAPNTDSSMRLESPGASIIAVFNDHTDPNFVGAVSEVTGLDSAEVQEAFLDVTDGDGGYHLPFYWGRRPVTITGLVYGHASQLVRAQRLDRIIRASSGMRADSTLKWTPAGGVQVRLLVRRQQPLRIAGAWNKEFQIALVSAYPFIETAALNTLQTTSGVALPQALNPENRGSAPALPELLRVRGPITDPRWVNDTTGEVLLDMPGTIGNNITVDFDFKNKTASDGTNNYYQYLDFLDTTWAGVPTGTNTIRMYGSGGGANTYWRLDWRDAWF